MAPPFLGGLVAIVLVYKLGFVAILMWLRFSILLLVRVNLMGLSQG